MDKISKIANRGIWYAYLALAVITPLLFSTRNSELFEVPKMLFVYLGAVIIATLTHLKFVSEKKHTYPANIVLISLAVLFLTQVASTFTSIDKFTSIYGYPSRLNGGVLSLFAYTIILTGVFNLTREKILTLLQTSIIAAVAVSLWGIPGHFGYDPNCFLLTGHLTSTCWQKEFDPTLRIFSTLGQPNWLASYLVLIIPTSIAHIFISKKRGARNFFIVSTIILLTALIFTNSRAGIAGFFISIIIFIFTIGLKNLKKYSRVAMPLFLVSLFIIAAFSTSLIARTKEALGQTSSVGTESGAIRLIVWRGAINVFKNNPVLGTGPETFAYSYYKVRPLEHNQTTEWNFFYNKAHNEFLNYLANTGTLGFSAYIFFLTATSITIFKISRVSLGVGPHYEDTSTLAKAVFASLIGYQITIFFGFSTVATQLLMFLLIASCLVLGKKENLKFMDLKFLNKNTQLVALALVIIIGVIGIIYVARIYTADIFYAKAKGFGDQKSFDNAINLLPTKNPFYLAETAYTAASQIQETEDENQKTKLLEYAKAKADTADKYAPNNLLVLRRIANTYLLVSQIDQSFWQKSLDVSDRLIKLAPTDPQTYLTVAKIQTGVYHTEDAKKTLNTALQLKSDYPEAQDLLDQIENSTYNINADDKTTKD